jgi:hypothetical protein
MEIALGGGASPYLEYGWVCAPNAAGQSITANTITTLTLDTEIVDTGDNGSIASNQVTLASGTYYFKATHTFKRAVANNPPDALFRLYNVTDSNLISCDSGVDTIESAQYSGKFDFEGQFTISGSKAIRLEVAYSDAVTIGISGQNAFTLSTASAQTRTKLQLWKLA